MSAETEELQPQPTWYADSLSAFPGANWTNSIMSTNILAGGSMFCNSGESGISAGGLGGKEGTLDIVKANGREGLVGARGKLELRSM